MKKNIFGIFVLLAMIVCVDGVAQDSDSSKIKKLEDSVETLNNRLKADYYMFKEGGFKERLEAESKKWEAEAANFKADVRNENWLVALIILICGGVSVSLIGVFYFQYKKRLEELVKTEEAESKNKLETLFLKYELETNNRIEKLKEEQEQKIRHLDSSFLSTISDLIRSSPENLKKIIHTREEEYRIIRNAEILVISASKDDGTELSNLFSNYGFDTNKIEYTVFDDYTPIIDKSTYELIKKRTERQKQMLKEEKTPNEIEEELDKEEFRFDTLKKKVKKEKLQEENKSEQEISEELEKIIYISAPIEKEFDIILFNNENNGLKKQVDENSLKEYEKGYSNQKRVYFFYGKGFITGFDNANYANSKFTFYDNMLALLRHKKMMM